MRKLLTAITAASIIIGSAPVQADQVYRPRHHHHHNGNNNNWVVPLIGGLIIGGAIAGSNGYNYQHRPVRCYREYTGEYWNGWEWVQTYRKVCY